MELTKLSKLKTNPRNPRTITDAQFERLKDSLLVFPKMLTLRPLATDGNGIVLGGNMRLRALKDIAKMTAEQIAERLQGMKTYNQKSEAEQTALVEYWRDWLTRKDVPTTHESTLTDAEKDEFVMTDNASFGSWDFDAIANEWDAELVEEWGVDVWQDDVSEDEQGNENDYDNEDDNELKDENVETMLNDATTLVANDLIKQFDTLQGFTFITPNTAKFDFIRFAYYGKEYPRYNSLAFHTKQFITAGDKFSTYEGLNKVSRGEIKAERLRFVCQDKFRAIISGSLAFCGAKMPLDFPAELARDLIDEFSNGGKVLDPCAGWGGRMVGFLASNATRASSHERVQSVSMRGCAKNI